VSRKLPSVTSDIPRDLRQFIDRIRDIITDRGNGRFITAEDLLRSGLAASGPQGSIVSPTTRVTTTPSTPQNLTATGSLNNIVLRWDDPNYDGHAYAEVYRNTVDDIFEAALIGTSSSTYYIDSVGYLESYYYWVRFANTAGKFGEYYSADGVLGTSEASITYTTQDLRDDLASGAVEVVSGVANGTAVMQVYPSYVMFQHRDAVPLGASAAYNGDYHTALGITSTGIVGGYNNPSTGAWQTTLALEASTGNLTVLGTIKASSIIEVGAYLGGSTVSSVLTDVSSAASNASSALSAVTGKLNKSASDILSGDITFTSAGGFKTGTISIDGSGNVTGAGVAFTSKGIAGRTASQTTFSLNATTGEAIFAGNLNTAGDAVFAGNNTSAVQLSVGGGPTYVDYAVFADATSAVSAYPKAAFVGYAPVSGSQFNIGVFGNGKGTDTTFPYTDVGVGMYGEGESYGGWFATGNVSGAAVYADNSSSGAAIQIFRGYFKWGAVNINSPDGSNTKYLRADGQWVTLSASGTGTVTSVSGTGSVSGITLSGTVTTAGNLTLGGSLSLTSTQITNGLGYTPISPTTLASYATAADTVSYIAGQLTPYGKSFSASNSISGVSFTVSGSGTNNVTYTLASTSDRSLKTDIQPSSLGMDFLRQLTPVSYYYVDDPMFGFKKKMYGLIANDVMPLVAEESSLVYTNEAGPLEGKLAVDYASYVAPIITALKELDARITQLEEANVT
jgi:hypothetical protein